MATDANDMAAHRGIARCDYGCGGLTRRVTRRSRLRRMRTATFAFLFGFKLKLFSLPQRVATRREKKTILAEGIRRSDTRFLNRYPNEKTGFLKNPSISFRKTFREFYRKFHVRPFISRSVSLLNL